MTGYCSGEQESRVRFKVPFKGGYIYSCHKLTIFLRLDKKVGSIRRFFVLLRILYSNSG